MLNILSNTNQFKNTCFAVVKIVNSYVLLFI